MQGVNVRLLRKTIATKGGERIASRANGAIRDRLNTKKQLFLEAFDDHPVTQEIQGGPEGASEFVHTDHGGNLFSLLGFEKGQKPIPELRSILNNNITMDTNKKRVKTTESGRIMVEVPVNIISLGEIYEQTSVAHETKLDWTERSFVDLIQSGITGFGEYLAGVFEGGNSRSTRGIEAKKPLRAADLGAISYLNRLLEDFKQSLKPRQ